MPIHRKKVKAKKPAKGKRMVDKVFNRGGVISRLKGRTAKELKKLGI